MNVWIGMGAIFCALGVAIGAFGAHGLKPRLSPEMLAIFEVGARYHMYHALGMFAVALAASRSEHPAITWAGWLLVVGVVIFSGSLYALSISGVTMLGAIAPVGGLCLIAGWGCLAWSALKKA